MNRALSVLRILFHNILAVVMSTVRVVSSPVYLIRFPLAVILTRLGLSFGGLKSTTRWAYVTTLSWGIRLISLCVITKMEQVTGVFVLLSPWAMMPNYFPNAVDHISRVTGSLTRFWYLVIVSPVMGWMTGAQKCSMFTFKFSFLVVGLSVTNAHGVHWYTGYPYNTFSVIRLTASWEIIWEW